MTDDDKRNEHLKLVANLGNAVTAGLIAAGVFVPLAQEIFNILPKETDFGLVVGVGMVCFVLGLCIHIVSHLFLGWLR